MNQKLITGIIVLVAAVLCLHIYVQWEIARFDASLPTPPAEEEQQSIDETADDTAEDTVEDTSGGHWHGDEWHGEPHRDALLDDGMHFTDLREQIEVLETGNPELQESPTYELPPGISHEDARRVHEAYKKWNREVWQPAHDEWWQLAQEENRPALMRSLSGTDFAEYAEYVSSLSDAEYEKAVAEMEAYDERRRAAWERYQAVERDKPDFVAEVLGGE